MQEIFIFEMLLLLLLCYLAKHLQAIAVKFLGTFEWVGTTSISLKILLMLISIKSPSVSGLFVDRIHSTTNYFIQNTDHDPMMSVM